MVVFLAQPGFQSVDVHLCSHPHLHWIAGARSQWPRDPPLRFFAAVAAQSAEAGAAVATLAAPHAESAESARRRAGTLVARLDSKTSERLYNSVHAARNAPLGSNTRSAKPTTPPKAHLNTFQHLTHQPHTRPAQQESGSRGTCA